MKNLDQTAKELFAKIRGRFPGVTIGDSEGNVTQEPTQARFFEFPFREGQANKISISLSEDDGVVIMHNKDVAENEVSKSSWYDFLKELRVFAKKRMLNFETRDINKSNLEKRDYQYLANRSEEDTMNESKLYGTSRVSYQNVDNARLVIKHTESVNTELASGRTQKIGKIYIESADGERFMYPYKHLSGARAMARHVAEGGKPFDDFGKHITGLSEELSKLRKFKTYMGRSSVMAESLSEYVDVVKERIQSVKKTVESLQKPNYYKEAVEGFEAPMLEDVPEDVAENWIDQLTIKQFNEELKDVFPYIYKLVSEATRAKELGPDDLDESGLQRHIGIKKYGKKGFEELQKAGREGASEEEKGAIKDKYLSKEEIELEAAFEDMMGQFAEGERHGNSKIYDKCWKGYRKVPGKKAGEKGSCKKIEGVELESLDSFFEGRDDSPQGDRVTTDKNPLVSTYDDEFKPGQPGLSGHMNLKTYMSIIGISEKYQEELAQAVLDAGVGEKISVPEDARADYDAEREEEGLPQRALWIALSQHHEKEKESDNANEDEEYGKAPASKKVLQLVVDDIKKLKAEQDDMAKQGYDEDVEMIERRLKDLMQIAELVKDGGYLAGVDTAVADEVVDYYQKAGEPLPFAAEGNAYAHAVRKAKMDGKKKGDKIDGPDGDQITLEKEGKLPITEFILSYFDRETGQFPKGETAVLTMVEKDYGEEFIEPAKAFIEQVNNLVAERYGYKEESSDLDRIKDLAGL